MSVLVNQQGVLAGKVAVITGASRGIGDALARRFAMEGAKVVVSARTVSEGDHYLPGSINQTVADIKAAGGEAIAVQADLAKAEDRQSLVDAALAAYGAIDILVNNAAITYFIPVADFPEKRFQLMMDVQVWAPSSWHNWCCQACGSAVRLDFERVFACGAPPEKSAPGKGGTVYGMCKAAQGVSQRVWRKRCLMMALV